MSKSKDGAPNEVIVGMRRNGGKQRQPGITGIDFWEGPFTGGEQHHDMADFLKPPNNTDERLASGVYRDETFVSAIVEAYDFCEMFNLDRQKKELNNRIMASLGMGGFGKTGQIQLGVGVGLPGVIREQLQMRRVKMGEDAQRGSDFRSEGNEREVKQGD